MNIRLTDIMITFKKAHEQIDFKDFNYFYGQMGAGKSTIVRLIDFCLGGDLGKTEMTTALQAEFVSASLSLKVADFSLVLERNAHFNKIRARWSAAEQQFEVLIPVRTAAGEVLPGTGVEVLSDLIYYLAGKKPPKVRRSKIKDDSELERLSLRDLLWYCYLDQDSMDSSFFHLDSDANQWKRLKSKDVLRFIVGFHQEHVADLEVQLELVRVERQKCKAGATAISNALSSAEIATDVELADVRCKLESDIEKTEVEISSARDRIRTKRSHAMETLQDRARYSACQIDDLKNASGDIRNTITKDKAHKNELLALATRFRRSQSAREILSGVDFKNCPRCGNELQPRPLEFCPVCGQLHSDTPTGALDENAAEQDLQLRVGELTELISLQEIQLRKIMRHLRELVDKKAVVDAELTRVSVDYDSAYLSNVLETEKYHSALQQQLLDLNKLEVLVQQIAELSKREQNLAADEQRIRAKLKDARVHAERDTQNLNRLKQLFIDCLLRAKIPGFFLDDIVEIRAPHFLPEVTSAGSGALAVTSFTNLGSGGKKTLFKCCFAVAVHRLAVEVGAMLPTLLLIDSPMKNISERGNRAQFEGFFEMLYDLCNSELKGTQFILIDKELCAPPKGFQPSFKARHMTPDDEKHPPLIRYYRGK
jgi:rRNA maturation endonuclease Nob1